MKKFIVVTLSLLLFASFASADAYPAAGVVVGFEPESDIVLVEESNGTIWAFEGIEDWQLGDLAALLMDDSGTELIFDDQIVLAHYTGFSIPNNPR